MDLQNVKEGDEILVPHRYGSGAAVATVARVTETQVVTTDGQRFTKKSGKQIGSGTGFASVWARVASPEEIAATKQKNRIKAAQEKLSLFRVTADNLAAVEHLLSSR